MFEFLKSATPQQLDRLDKLIERLVSIRIQRIGVETEVRAAKAAIGAYDASRAQG